MMTLFTCFIISSIFLNIVGRSVAQNLELRGCSSAPPSPINAENNCNAVACTITCKPGYIFPNGVSQISLTCQNNDWIVEGGDFDGTPACQPVCQPPCQNNGVCESPNKCSCPTGFSGQYCEIRNTACTSRPDEPLNSERLCSETKCMINCKPGYQFPDGSTLISLQCENGEWVENEPKWTTLPNCEAVCVPPCQNNGNCTAPNHCNCPEEFRGPQCQYNVDRCVLLFNGNRKCTDDGDSINCTLSCPPEMEFKAPPAPSYTCQYSEGVFGPEPIPECVPSCKTCQVVGDPHYVTFDGKRYDFMGRCSYYLVKMATLSIEGENRPCRGYDFQEVDLPSLPSCTKSVTVRISGHVIKLDLNHMVIVDGRVINKLPHRVADTTISRASSEFLQVDLPYDMRLMWNSMMTAYINVPSTLKQTTVGLCGTPNNNVPDDFTTSEGYIEEDIIPFGNSWKTLSSCTDLPNVTQPHPCTVNENNKPQAEEKCQIIKSEIFNSCHWKVDPDPYFQNCRYDTCNCNEDLSKCACLIIGAYADDCARNGIRIDWKNQVPECAVNCPNDQQYQVCGNPCARSCMDIATRPNCREQCVEGCNCPEGKSLDENDKCVPIRECKCQYNGLPFPPGYQETRLVEGNLTMCTCANAQWTCTPIITPITCDETENLELTECKPKELLTCDNGNPENSTESCFSGCKCKNGYVLDTSINKCVQLSQCACYHEGKYYKSNTTIENDCNTCQCQNGNWECTERLCAAECSVWGDSHYKTFDGKHYDFQGQCDYVLASADVGNYSFVISTQNIPCGSLGTTCSKSVTIRVKSGDKEDNLTLIRDTLLPHDLKFNFIKMRQVGLFVIIEAPELGLTVRWDQGTRVYVKVDSRWTEEVQGLCGNYNYNEIDDFQTRSMEVVVSPIIFGNSWKLEDSCPNAVEVINPCEERPNRREWAINKCNILNSSVFESCHDQVPVDIYHEKCIFDACACDQGGDCECLCTAIAAYVEECNNKGLSIRWRSQKLCPMQCDQPSYEYKPCISKCPVETCNDLYPTESNENCNEEGCVEGCAPKPCPPDHVYLNSSFSECVRKDNCECDPQKSECPNTSTTPTPSTITPSSDPETPTQDICSPSEVVTCGYGEIKTLIHNANGCDEDICECKPPEQCEPLQPQEIPLPDGYVQITDRSGCCPKLVTVCQSDLCPPPQSCPQYYVLKSETQNDKCCPSYTCEQPKDKCIYENRYIAAENGGERARTEEEKERVVKDSEETWNDGPCRQCNCSVTTIGDCEATCAKISCPVNDLEMEDYTLQEVPVPNQCCPDIKRVACKYEGKVYRIGETWTEADDPCAQYKCVDRAGSALKVTQVLSCDENCNPGFRYEPATAESGQCCGSCQPYGCVFNGTIYEIGKKWLSDDRCVNYECVENNETIQLRSQKVSCPKPSPGYTDKYFYETTTIPGKCCEVYNTTACKVDGKKYQVGKTWPSPDGDKCKKFACVKNNKNEIVALEIIENCNTNCSKGWEYRKSANSCCGECVQTACVVDDELKQLGEEWASADNCTKYSCQKIDNQFIVSSSEESCPSLEDCPEENIYMKGCCQHCNYTGRDQALCGVETVQLNNTIGIVKLVRRGRGQCMNKKPIESFTECRGTCLSSVSYNAQRSKYETECSCCQILDFTSLTVNLECDNGDKMVTRVSVPSKCGCGISCTKNK